MKDLILTSLRAQAEYVPKRIQGKGALYYTEMMNDIQRVVQAFDNFAMPLVILETSFSQLRNQRFSLNEELKYKKMALQHAIDVVLTISNRFGPK